MTQGLIQDLVQWERLETGAIILDVGRIHELRPCERLFQRDRTIRQCDMQPTAVRGAIYVGTAIAWGHGWAGLYTGPRPLGRAGFIQELGQCIDKALYKS